LTPVLAWRRHGLVLLAMASAVGCRRQPADDDDDGATGRLEVRWSGADSGHFARRATAEWCPASRVLTLIATDGDTAVGVALHPAKLPAPGRYPVVDPATGSSLVPRSALALRYFATTTVSSWSGRGGMVTIDAIGDGDLSGAITGTLQGGGTGRQITMTGSFRGLRMRPMREGCDTAANGQPPSAGVD
jgi:hypothetical protein